MLSKMATYGKHYVGDILMLFVWPALNEELGISMKKHQKCECRISIMIMIVYGLKAHRLSQLM